ncbi:flagellar motor protein MotB [Jannaschia pohangensis]|uniref:Chemotaxis protein MotB n=1 Tax=Jannaschia pohangensis TaxID=390807 RepID=A0A1I3JVH1_9RHOB|nr:flagellar motor protein MotB [Jannaschia pohangensis]SFI64203.1 chemotaxis protein MotB [Jannaschia pohangensis]
MSKKDDNTRPIIIKRKKVVEGGHHGGAWKVAYADFVTAMMAFFLLMWLLNATTDQQRRGLADYFSPTVSLTPVSAGGDGVLTGQSMSGDASMIQLGRGGITQSDANGTAPEDGVLEAIEAAIMGKGGESLLDREDLRHVAVRLTDEGLVIEFFDLPDSPLYDGVEVTPLLERLLASVAGEVRKVPNSVAIDAYIASVPVVERAPQSWEVSSGRGHALRRRLPDVGVSEARVVRVTGHADRRPAATDPMSSRNNRVEIIVLRDTVPLRR